jgi:hypothetical protein
MRSKPETWLTDHNRRGRLNLLNMILSVFGVGIKIPRSLRTFWTIAVQMRIAPRWTCLLMTGEIILESV